MIRSLLLLPFLLLLNLSLAAQSQTQIEYIQRYKDIAIREMDRAGIPASIKLAQGLLESAAGTSHLARTANNHFGVKCGSNWDGKKAYRKDDDYDEHGKLLKSCFRVYKDAEDSFIAHSEFLRDPRKSYRYGFLFRLDPTDYRRWAKGLKKSGYATSATYDQKLITIIERYELFKYDKFDSDDIILADRDKKDDFPEETRETLLGIHYINDVEFIFAETGDTPLKIADRTGIPVDKLLEYNEKVGFANTGIAEGSHVYLEKKRNRFRGNKRFHYVKSGETMYKISQMYGIKLEKLYKRNMMPEGSEPLVRERILLKGRIKDESERPKFTTDGKVPMIDESEEEKVDLDKITWPPEDIFGDDTIAAEETNDEDEDEEEEGNFLEGPAISNPTLGLPEEEIKIGVPEETETENNTETKPTTPKPVIPNAGTIFHVVVKGETLYSISKRYDMTVQELKDKNGLTDNIISIGQKLRIQ